MSTIRFEVTSRQKSDIITTIRAKTKDMEWNMTLYLDNETGAVLYPVTIKQAVPCVTITLDADFTSSCGLPPSVPDIMVDNIAADLTAFHDIVAAARELIREEQEKFRDTHVE